MSPLPPTPAERPLPAAHLTERAGADSGPPPGEQAGRGSYLQRWSALSSKGVSFSRNSKAELTSSVKSYKSQKLHLGSVLQAPTA